MVSIPQRWSRRGGVMALTVSLSALLAACGGGGGHHHDDPIVVPEGARVEPASSNSNVSSGNFDALAGPLVSLVGSAGGSPAEGTLSPQKQSQAAVSAKKRPGPAGGASSVAHLLKSVVQTLYKNPPKAAAGASGRKSQALALSSVSHLCVNSGGSWRSTTDDSDNNGFPSRGDRISVLFDNCQVDSLALTTDGGFTFVIDDVDFDRDDNIIGLIVEGRYDELTVGSAASLDGAFTAWQTLDDAGVETYRFSYDDVQATTQDGSAIYNVDIEGEFAGSVNTYAIDGAITLGNQTYQIIQGPTWFRANQSAIPSRGLIYLQDFDGDRLSMEASSNERLDFGFIPAGSNQPTFVLLDQTWSDFGI